MNQNDFVKFEALIFRTCDMLGQKQLRRDSVKMSFDLLSSYSLEDVIRGVSTHLRDPDRGRFMPKVADIVAAIVGDPEVRASEAWAKVHAAISRVGGYESIVFDDPIIHVVLHDMGGWMNLCRVTLEDYKFREIGFLKRYKAYCGRDFGRYPKSLPGEFEISNRANGQPVKRPVMIGNPEQAMLTYDKGTDKPRIERTPYEGVESFVDDEIARIEARTEKEEENDEDSDVEKKEQKNI